MSELRPFPRTPRAIISYDYIQSMLGQEVLICVPKGGYQIARDFLVASGFFTGSYYTNIIDNGYYTPDDNQFDELDNVVSGFLAGEVIDMGCLENLIVSIDCLCQAIYNTSGIGGSGGAGQFPAVPEDFVDNGSDFPAGFDDRSEYSAAKCDLAQFVLDRLSSDFDRLKVVNVAGQGALAAAALLRLAILTPIPHDDIVLVIAASVLALTAVAIEAYITALEELQTRIEAMSICELYQATSVNQAVANVEEWISGGTYTLSTLTIALGHGLIGVDALNILFAEKSDNVNYDELPTGDCSGCVCDSGFSITFGTGPSTPANFPMTFESVLHPSQPFYYIAVTSFDVALSVSFDSISGHTPTGSADDFRVGTGGVGSDDLYSSATFPQDLCLTPSGGNERLQFTFTSDTPFEVLINCC